jgi:hypothetical protein
MEVSIQGRYWKSVNGEPARGTDTVAAFILVAVDTKEIGQRHGIAFCNCTVFND